MMLKQTSFTDTITGLPIVALGSEAGDTGHLYFTAMSWLSNSRHLIAYTDMDRETWKGNIVRFDTETGHRQVLEEGRIWGSGAVSSDDILYLLDKNELYAIDAWSGQRRTICKLEEHCTFFGPLSITNDGKVLGVYWKEALHPSEGAESQEADWVIGTVNSVSGEVREAARPRFNEPYPVANHAMINPADSQQVFFSHEGATEQIPDRLWVVDTRTGDMRNLFSQKRAESGLPVEYVGHEIWAFDGSGLYFVKYPHSPDQPTGVYFVDRQGEHSEFINGDYRYWHVGISPDGKYAVADTQEPGISKIVLINTATKQSTLLCELPCRGMHPGHPHPSFSPDSRKIAFTFSDAQDVLQVGIIDVSNLK
ncbi:TolB family protein [Paenibacillus alba]|uniref:TolB family protein n=1 Tax=Paenibacillus alba TaxID=1197127 RepID=UPI00156624E3|nr:hypothetical protein [Paenibacillus alba]